MPSDGPTDNGSPPRPIRLNGWKEIASYLDRGVRTVQRWERDGGLPVRRIGTGGGEVVYALVEEIERWLDSAAAKSATGDPPDPNEAPGNSKHGAAAATGGKPGATARPAMSRRRAAWVASGAVLVVVVLATLAWTWVDHRAAAEQPASWKVANNALVVFDRAGRVLWTHPFDFRLTESAYQKGPAANEDLQPVVIDDIDGDGNLEVLFVSEPWLPTSHGLYCFDHRGNLLFHHAPPSVVRFGEQTYGPPWRGAFVSTTGLPGRPHDIWFVSTHIRDFPTVLEKLDVSGHVKGQYLEQRADLRGCDMAARRAVARVRWSVQQRVQRRQPCGTGRYGSERCRASRRGLLPVRWLPGRRAPRVPGLSAT